jgi:hypothetical protein
MRRNRSKESLRIRLVPRKVSDAEFRIVARGPMAHDDPEVKTTRICVGLAVWILIMGPFLALAKLSYDIRGYSLLGRFASADVELPLATESLWIFGAVGWWAYLTPAALAVAVASALRKPLSGIWLVALAGGSSIQFIAFHAAILPYYKVATYMSSPPSVAIPAENLIANLALLGTSLGLASWSVAVAVKRERFPSPETPR